MAALPENDRLAGPYIAEAGQTDFAADFPLLEGSALRVRIERGAGMITLVPPGVVPVDGSETGFTARLSDPAQAGDRVWVFSLIPPARPRAHTPHGVVRTVTLEDDAEGFQAQHQEVRRDLGRTLMLPFGDAAPNLPTAPYRRETVMVFDANGDLQVMPIPTVVNDMGGAFEDFGPWGLETDPLTKDYGAFG